MPVVFTSDLTISLEMNSGSLQHCTDRLIEWMAYDGCHVGIHMFCLFLTDMRLHKQQKVEKRLNFGIEYPTDLPLQENTVIVSKYPRWISALYVY